MHYVLEYYGLPGKPRRAVSRFPRIPGVRSWQLGQKFLVDVPVPIHVELEPGTDCEPQPLINSTFLLMRNDLLEGLQDAGVTNLDVYPTILTDRAAGREWIDFCSVNVVGVVAAADFTKSTFHPHGSPRLIDVDFESLAIDEGRVRGLKMFRLAECVTALIIDEAVKRTLEQRGFSMLDFVPTAEWIG